MNTKDYMVMTIVGTTKQGNFAIPRNARAIRVLIEENIIMYFIGNVGPYSAKRVEHELVETDTGFKITGNLIVQDKGTEE